MEPLVTVSIAAYNVERFLENGVNSILHQTYKNLEILLVDDGSTDKTPQMCDQLAEADQRIRVIHKENGGLGSARNVGIDAAKGKYLYFFDVDDTVEPNLIEENVRYAEEKDVDLVIFGFYARQSNQTAEEVILPEEREIHSNEELKKAYTQNLLWLKHGNGFAWNKFYRLSFLRKYNFHFGNQRIQQDEPFNMQLYLKLENVYICAKAYYHYVIYQSGNAGSRYLENKEEIITDIYHKFMSFYQRWNIQDENVLRYIQRRYVSGIFMTVTGNYYHEKCHLTAKEKKNRIYKILHDPELTSVIQQVKIESSKNPVNAVQAWAFNHGNVTLLMHTTTLKATLKKFLK